MAGRVFYLWKSTQIRKKSGAWRDTDPKVVVLSLSLRCIHLAQVGSIMWHFRFTCALHFPLFDTFSHGGYYTFYVLSHREDISSLL